LSRCGDQERSSLGKPTDLTYAYRHIVMRAPEITNTDEVALARVTAMVTATHQVLQLSVNDR
jgi:hypothetical protein